MLTTSLLFEMEALAFTDQLFKTNHPNIKPFISTEFILIGGVTALFKKLLLLG